MKITPSKPAPAPSTPERSQPSTTKSGNTGIVPPAQSKPADSFQSTKPTGTGGTTASSGTTSTTMNRTSSVSTYALAPALEPYRAEFDRVGQHIAKLPSHVQEDAILRESSRLSKKFADIASPKEVEDGVRMAAAWGRSTTTDEPQAYAARSVDMAMDTVKDLGSLGGRLTDYARRITRDPSQLDARSLLRNLRMPRQEQQQSPDETRQLFRRMPRWF